MAKLISVINQKGGTGKTTTAINLAAALQRLRHRVLLMDFDSQCNLSLGLGIQNAERHIGHVMQKHCTFDEAIVQCCNLDIIPASVELIDYEHRFINEPGREFILSELLGEIVHRYDYVIMDCPPAMSTLSLNSLVSADYYIVPMQAENFAFIGLDHILNTAETVKRRMNAKLELGGILLVMFNERTKFGQAVVHNLKSYNKLSGKLFDSYIRQDIALMESTAFHQPIFDYAPSSRGSIDYRFFANEFLKRYGS